MSLFILLFYIYFCSFINPYSVNACAYTSFSLMGIYMLKSKKKFIFLTQFLFLGLNLYIYHIVFVPYTNIQLCMRYIIIRLRKENPRKYIKRVDFLFVFYGCRHIIKFSIKISIQRWFIYMQFMCVYW